MVWVRTALVGLLALVASTTVRADEPLKAKIGVPVEGKSRWRARRTLETWAMFCRRRRRRSGSRAMTASDSTPAAAMAGDTGVVQT